MPKLIRSLLLLPLLAAATALAGELPFEQAAFDALQKEGKPILVEIYADWCPTCRVQKHILGELLKMPEFHGLTALRVDFDAQKDIVKSFRAQYQGTLIVFKGGREAGRSTGDTKRESIAALLRKVL